MGREGEAREGRVRHRTEAEALERKGKGAGGG